MANTKENLRAPGSTPAFDPKNQGQKQSQSRDRNPAGGNGTDIRERMNVVASCGTRIGVVDHVEGEAIKLTKNDSADGQHHFIPVGWVESVDNEVHLMKNSVETEREWKSSASEC